MSAQRFALMRLRRSRKKAVLVLPGGVIPVDREKVDEMIKWAFAQGWKTVDIEYLYGDPFERHCTQLVEYPS